MIYARAYGLPSVPCRVVAAPSLLCRSLASCHGRRVVARESFMCWQAGESSNVARQRSRWQLRNCASLRQEPSAFKLAGGVVRRVRGESNAAKSLHHSPSLSSRSAPATVICSLQPGQIGAPSSSIGLRAARTIYSQALHSHLMSRVAAFFLPLSPMSGA